MKKIIWGSVFCLSLSVGSVLAQQQLIPQPQEMQVGKKNFLINKLTISADDQTPEITYLQQQWQSILGTELKRSNQPTLKFTVRTDVGIAPEGYKLSVDDTGILVSASSEHGLFYGIQSLLQLLEENRTAKKLPYLQISDYPKFAYRGMHLDVCRHFFSVEEVKHFLDYIATYKINKFHWHLTDDQGWRIEIKSHPKLTEIGGFRKRKPFDGHAHQTANPMIYGGFYTQEQIKEIVTYAAALHIEVIPEIEMPGHAQAALAAYPELSCTGGPFEVGTNWGVMEDIFCPKEETFALLEDVIDEIIPLFPSNYIHIGGDEAPKTRWKACAHCQDLIRREGLKDEHELQSYFITRMEKYINSKGKKIIGWDEILQGGLAPNATVMSWTGIEGGIHAAKSGHDAIMTPSSHVYFDYYQGNPQTEPLAFAADLRLEKVYSYQPIPSELTAEEGKHVLGTQANMWTEYIPNFKQVQHMLFPRLMALSEVAWGTSNPKEYKTFENRVIAHFSSLDRKGIHYSKAIYEVVGKVVQRQNQLAYELHTAKDPALIRYTVDGSMPTVRSKIYAGPILVGDASIIRAAYFENGVQISAVVEQVFVRSKATAKSVTLAHIPSESYSKGGAQALVDGVLGSRSVHKEHWLGFIRTDAVATVDLGADTDVRTVGVSLLENKGIGVHYPAAVEISISQDNHTFIPLKTISTEAIVAANGMVKIDVGTQRGRYVKIRMKSRGKIPKGDPLADSDSWIFTDEIMID